MIKKLLLLFITVTLLDVSAQTGKGILFIIGGGKRPAYMIDKFVELSGKESANLVVIPMASSDPIDVAEYQKKQFEEHGAGKVKYVYCTLEEANTDSIISKMDGCNSVFFSGGDQNRLTEALLNTKLLERIKEIYFNGGVIGGTSAGAAVMSKIMITGDELLTDSSANAFSEIRADNIKHTEGFGFIDNAIVDQHFIYRKRHNRLISLTLEYPKLLGIGIDESTAIIVKNKKFEVFGDYQVMIFDAINSTDIKKNINGFLSASNIKLHILSGGDKFDLIERQPIK